YSSDDRTLASHYVSFNCYVLSSPSPVSTSFASSSTHSLNPPENKAKCSKPASFKATKFIQAEFPEPQETISSSFSAKSEKKACNSCFVFQTPGASKAC